jgi:uncharacterized protein (TIGR03000 family)
MRSRLLAGFALAAFLLTANNFSARAADVVVVKPVVYPVVLNPKFPVSAPAKVTISLPDDAILLFNGVAAPGDGKSRTFATPPLVPGQPYVYELTAMVVRGHQLVVATERVVVWSGEESKVTFALPAPAVTIPPPKKKKDKE